MTLENATEYNGLPVCEKCGWAMAGPHEEDKHKSGCPYVPAGKSATDLAARLPELPSTKFGSGTEALTFNIDDDLNIRFECRKGRFDLREVWLLGDLTVEDAAGLVKAIADWRRTSPRKRHR